MRAFLTVTTLSVGAVLGAGLAPTASAGSPDVRCDNKRVHTFASTLPPTHASSFHAGSKVRPTITVTRAGVVPASGINVGLTLRGPSWFAYGSAITDSDGVAKVTISVPKKARGSATLVVDVYRQAVSLPCGNIEEYDYVEAPWGKAVR